MVSTPRPARRLLLAVAVLLAVLVGFGGGALAAPPSKGGPGKKPTTTTTSTSTTTSTPSTSTTTVPPSTAPVIGAWRGVYAPHGWVAVPRPESEVRAAVSAVRDAGFDAQLLNVGYLDATGTIAPTVHPALGDWVEASRALDPSMKLIAWVNGGEAAHVDDTRLHATTSRWLADLVARHGLDGVLLDLEPFRRDNPAFVSLLQTVRAAMPTAWVGVNGPADGQWSATFIAAVAAPVDAIVPMHYDTSLTTTSTYSARVASEHGRFVAAAGAAASVLPALPAYARNTWHDPAVENIESAVAGIAASVPGSAAGAAVYSWHELDARSLDQWRTAIGG